MTSLVKKRYLSELRQIDWDFGGENTADGFASYHWYPARYVPQLAGILINYFSEPGEMVLDPFCGSGTTLVEAFKFGRKGLGIDLNPIAVLMSKAKLVAFDERRFASFSATLLGEARSLLSASTSLLADSDSRLTVPNCEENASWYDAETLKELASIWCVIQRHSGSKYAIVARTAFSAILKHCCSQDKHWGWICDNVKPKTMIYRDAFSRFKLKMKQYADSAKQLLADATELQETNISISDVRVIEGDCATVLTRFIDESFALVVTSPPYFSMTDYVRSQRLSFLWFDSDPDTVREHEIGARFKRHRRDTRESYLAEMEVSFRQIHRVLQKERFCCVVIGESPRHEKFLRDFEDICANLGFRLTESLSRRIAKQRALSPILHQEKILIFKKL